MNNQFKNRAGDTTAYLPRTSVAQCGGLAEKNHPNNNCEARRMARLNIYLYNLLSQNTPGVAWG